MKGKMNKDLDERLVPNGEYRDALNIQVSTSEESEVGTVQNILGNSLIVGQNFVSEGFTCVGSVADEKNDKLYYFITNNEDLVVNGGFDGGSSGWSLGSGWAYVNGKIEGNSASLYSKINQSNLPTGKIIVGKTYEVSFTVSNYVQGKIKINLYNENGDGFTINSFAPENKTYTFREEVTASITATTSYFSRFWIERYGNSGFTGDIDNISIKTTHDAIVEYNSSTNVVTPVLVDTLGSVLKFNKNNIITGINIIDNLLLWTDNENEPKKINIHRSILGTDKSGLIHTDLIVNDISEGTIKESHITVIKKSPYKAPKISSIANVKTGYVDGIMKPRPYFYPTGASGGVETGSEMWIGLPSLSSGPPLVEVGDTLLVYKGHAVPNFDLESPVARLMINEKKEDPNGFTFSQIQNNFDSSTQIANGSEVAVKVAVLSLDDHTQSDNKYYFKLEQSGKGIFEQKLPRFAYRYKYEDNEYSSVGPFSEVVFVPGAFEYHPTEAYNKGMINNLKELTLENFVTAYIPEDVVQIDLLYKNEFSPSVYVVKTIDKNKVHWGDGGKYTITTENIYAQLPSNQLLRPWDNVPKKALAQEITGNRVVYANYLQNYNLVSEEFGEITPNITANLSARFNPAIEIGKGLKSMKSQRTYNFGIVYGDEYGRETPVFTNQEANQLITKSSSADSNSITINVNNKHPDWADYYKIFIKETSNEYYNLATGRMYDAEDGNVWISFPSIDRNKVDEDTYLVLKKGSGSNAVAVLQEARYKIVAIENEAPDYIKTSYELIAEPNRTTAAAAVFGGVTSPNPLVNYPASIPLPGSQDFTIRKSIWEGTDPTISYFLGLPNMRELFSEIGPGDLYVSFSNVDKDVNLSWNDSPIRMSEKYKINSVEDVESGTAGTGYGGGEMYKFKMNKVIPASDGWYTDNVSTNDATGYSNFGGRLKPHFYKKIVENKPEFDGRFFVKIHSDIAVEKYLNYNADKNSQGFKVDAAIDQLYYIADEENPLIGTNEGTTGANGNSKTLSNWVNNFETNNGVMGSGRWFIDAAAFAGSQPADSSHPKDSEITQNGIALSDTTTQVYYYEYKPNTDQVTTYGNSSYGDLDPNTPEENVVWFQQPGGGTNDRGWQNIPHPTLDVNQNFFGGTAANPSFYLKGLQAVGNNPGENWTGYLHNNTNNDGDVRFGTETNLFKSQLLSTQKYLGTKQSLGAAWLKGAHTASYSDDPAILADLTGDGGYSSTGTDNYLHLSYGNIGPVRGVATLTSSGFGSSQIYKKEFWDTYNWKKNWNVGKNGSSSSDFGGVNANTNDQENIVKNLGPNKLFRLVGDANIYKIKKVTKRRLYNHQGAYNDEIEHLIPFEYFMVTPNKPRSARFIVSGGNATLVEEGTVYNTTNEFIPDPYAANGITEKIKTDNIALGLGDTGSLGWQNTSRYETHRRMVNPYNCRLSYLIKYEILDPSANSLIADSAEMKTFTENSEFDTSKMNLNDYGRLEFVSEFNTSEENLLTTDPAIFETEPKEDVGLDIYYEATGKIPTSTSSASSKIQNLVHVGATFTISPKTSQFGASSAFVNSVTWDDSTGGWLIQVSSNVNLSDFQDTNAIIKFHNDDGSYATATYIDIASAGFASAFRVTIHPNVIGLGWFNCWSFGNGVESNRIGDTYNKPFIGNGVKASTTLLDSYKEEHRKYGLIYSGIYNSTSGINDLNQFITAEKITKDINPTYGSIQKLHSRSTADGDLITLCEDRILKILANKDALFNADGNPQLIANNRVLGQTIPFSGDFGISTDPESFASESYRVYFTDKIRGAVLRLSKDGLTPISNAGMKDWFRDNLKLTTKLFGSYDDRNDEYNITLADRTILGEELIVNGNFKTDYTEWFGMKTSWFWKSGPTHLASDGTASARIGQDLIGSIQQGKTYQISYTIGKPDDTELDGRLWITLHDTDANYEVLSGTGAGLTTAGAHTKTISVNDSWGPWPYGALSDHPSSINFHNKSHAGSGNFNGTIDNISIKEIISSPVTVSYKENVKGWSSFKSFIPENALSMASNYYSLINGRIYLHNNENVDRNNFYGVGYKSSINVLLNDSPGTIKTFHTLNYEGSQSRVAKYLEQTKDGVTYSSQEQYNLTAKDGWFASAIITDKQKGSSNEFVKKEGKWFNYIKGGVFGSIRYPNSDQEYTVFEGNKPSELLLSDFGAFDLQGIGQAGGISFNPINPDGSVDGANDDGSVDDTGGTSFGA